MSETLASYTVTGSRNISAENVEYEIVLDNLNSETFYTANIVANNSFGSVISPEISFATAPLGKISAFWTPVTSRQRLISHCMPVTTFFC